MHVNPDTSPSPPPNKTDYRSEDNFDDERPRRFSRFHNERRNLPEYDSDDSGSPRAQHSPKGRSFRSSSISPRRKFKNDAPEKRDSRRNNDNFRSRDVRRDRERNCSKSRSNSNSRNGNGKFPPCVYCKKTNHPIKSCFFRPGYGQNNNNSENGSSKNGSPNGGSPRRGGEFSKRN